LLYDINGKAVVKEDLAKILTKIAAIDTNQIIVVAAAPDANASALLDILLLLRTKGFTCTCLTTSGNTGTSFCMSFLSHTNLNLSPVERVMIAAP